MSYNFEKYSHQKDVRQPQDVGLPPIHHIQKGQFSVMISRNIGGERTWIPIHNTWGWTYTQLGHAIRRARVFKIHNQHERVCVIKTDTLEVVWADWEVEDEPSYIEKGYSA